MYRYTVRPTASDLWQLSMYYVYGSLVGVCNIIFTAAVLALAVAKWSSVGTVYRIVLVLACLAFTVIQPLAIYRKAVKQAKSITEDTELLFDDKGIHVSVAGKKNFVSWKKIKRVSKKPTMIVVFLDTTHGYVLSNRLLGSGRDAFYEFVTSKMAGKSGR